MDLENLDSTIFGEARFVGIEPWKHGSFNWRVYIRYIIFFYITLYYIISYHIILYCILFYFIYIILHYIILYFIYIIRIYIYRSWYMMIDVYWSSRVMEATSRIRGICPVNWPFANWNIPCFFKGKFKEFLWAMLPCSIANSEITIAIEHHNV